MNDSPSSGERPGKSPNQRGSGLVGVVGPRYGKKDSDRNARERAAADGESPVREAVRSPVEP